MLLKAALTFCPGFRVCDCFEQTKADQHLRGAAFHTRVEAEDGPLMTHSPPSLLEWACSAGNRPETQAPRRPETWWCLPACLPNKSCRCGGETKPPPPPLRLNHTNQTWSKHVIHRVTMLTPSLSGACTHTHTAAHFSRWWCAAQWCVITPRMAHSPSLGFLTVSCAATLAVQQNPHQKPRKYFTTKRDKHNLTFTVTVKIQAAGGGWNFVMHVIRVKEQRNKGDNSKYAAETQARHGNLMWSQKKDWFFHPFSPLHFSPEIVKYRHKQQTQLRRQQQWMTLTAACCF